MYPVPGFHVRDLLVREGTSRVVVEAVHPAVLVVDGDPEVSMDRMIPPGRDHRECGHDVRGDPPVVVVLVGVAPRPDEQPAIGLNDLEEGLEVLHVVLVALGTLEQRITLEATGVQPGHMA